MRSLSTSLISTGEEEEGEVLFTRENRGESAQQATRATPTRSSHGPMRASSCAIPIYSSAVAFIHTTLPCLRPAEWGELLDGCRSVGIILRFVLEEALAYYATVVMLCAHEEAVFTHETKNVSQRQRDPPNVHQE